jgi:hypothetical protein
MSEAYARGENPETSHDAADSVRGEAAGLLESKVYNHVFWKGDDGATAWEICQITGIPNESLTPRLAPLRRKGLIKDSGKRRPGGSGRNQIVWVNGSGIYTPKKKEPTRAELLARIAQLEARIAKFEPKASDFTSQPELEL